MESCVESFIRPRYRILPPEFYTLAYAAYGGIYIAASLLWLW